MIFGHYPCCNAPLTLELPTGKHKLPAFTTDKCPECGTVCWHKLSRWDPMSWTEKDFLEEFEIDEETKQIKPRSAPSPSVEPQD